MSSSPALRTLQELDEDRIREDSVRRLSTAQVALADHALLRRDFPALERASDEWIDRWLIEHAGLVAEAQLGQTEVNSAISTSGPPLRAYRPPRYGRSVVVALEQGGLLDLKGVGVAPGRRPRNAPYATGLEYLGVALGDYLLKRVIDEIFRRTAPSLSTVPVYAVLDLGFDVRDGWRGTGPAGLHVRRAHRRPPGGAGLPESGSDAETMSVFIELLLRSYGLTSANHGNCLVIEERDGGLRVSSSERDISHALDASDVARLRRLKGERGDLRIERINLQLTREVDASRRVAQVFDFGHVNIRAEFHNPLASTVSDSWLCVGGLLWPDSSSFVMPDPRLAAPLALWHRHAVNDFCFGLAGQRRAGALSSGELRQAIETRIGQLVSAWPEVEP